MANQYLGWYKAQCFFFITVGICCLVGGVVLGRIFWQQAKKDTCNEGEYLCVSWISFIMAGGGGIVCLLVNLRNLIQVWVAPKIVLIEYITKLVK